MSSLSEIKVLKPKQYKDITLESRNLAKLYQNPNNKVAQKRSGQPNSIYDNIYNPTGAALKEGYDTQSPPEVHYGVFSGSGSGYGHSSGSGSIPCCPLVVDPLTLAAILGLLTGGTVLLSMLISASLGRRKKRSDGSEPLHKIDDWSNILLDFFHHGRKIELSASFFILKDD